MQSSAAQYAPIGAEVEQKRTLSSLPIGEGNYGGGEDVNCGIVHPPSLLRAITTGKGFLVERAFGYLPISVPISALRNESEDSRRVKVPWSGFCGVTNLDTGPLFPSSSRRSA